jgi:hypothetical protein
MFLDQTPKPYFHQKKILVDQLAAAKYISTSIPQDQKITGVDWFNAPEISYLTNRKIERHVENKEIKYIILHLYGKFLSGDMYNNVYANIPLKKLYANDSYEVYERLATTSAEVTQSL